MAIYSDKFWKLKITFLYLVMSSSLLLLLDCEKSVILLKITVAGQNFLIWSTGASLICLKLLWAHK